MIDFVGIDIGTSAGEEVNIGAEETLLTPRGRDANKGTSKAQLKISL